MKIEVFSPEKWISKAEARGINMLRCMYWTHDVSRWTNYRYMKNHLLIFVERGSISVEIDAKVIKLNAGDVVWIPPGVVRRTKAENKNIRGKDYKLHFNIGNGKTEAFFSGDNPILRNVWELLPLFQMLNGAYRNPLKYGNYFSRGICLALAAKYLSLRGRVGKRTFLNEQFNKFSSFIADNATRRISPDELASMVKLSPDYFSRKFKNDCGISPKGFIKREKIRFIASFILESDLSIKETAWHFGYDDPSYFCRQFKEIMKCSPMVHRKKNI